MNKIKNAFMDKKAFIGFITCGDPDLDTTKKAIKEMEINGASLIELGIPFSDPTAEGEVIEEANARALAGGVTTDKIFDMVKELSVNVPLVFMTYSNVVFSYGSDEFFKKCKEVGISGIILPDLPYEEKGEFLEYSLKYDVALISLIAPTSNDRIKMIAKDASGFIYLVSSLGVTGERTNINTDLNSIVKVIKQHSDLPCAIGFGISTPKQAKEFSQVADGVIVGSAIVRLLKEHGKNAPKYIGEYVKSMVEAIC